MNQGKLLRAPVLALMALAFILGGCEYVAVAILPEIAQALGASLGAAGKLVSVFAAGYAVGTPLLTALVSRYPRRRVMACLLVLFAACNLISALAPNLAVLYVARACTAAVTGTATAVALLLVRTVAPQGRVALAISWIYTSMSLASVVGNPLAKTLCRLAGWRAVFLALLLLSLLLLPLLLRQLPGDEERRDGDGACFFHQFAVLRDRRYVLCVLMTVCIYAATYVVYTYLTPILTDVIGAKAGWVNVLLMLVGLCGMASNLLAGWLGEHGGVLRLSAVAAMQCALFLLMPLLLRSVPTGLFSVFAMALLMYLASTPVQSFALEVAARDYPFASGLCASTLSVSGNIGIALGSFAGSVLEAPVGLELLGIPAAGVALAALALNLALGRACRQYERLHGGQKVI